MDLRNWKVYECWMVKFNDLNIFIVEIKELFQFQGLTWLLSSRINVPCYTKVVHLFYVNFEIGSNYDHSSYVYNVHMKVGEEVINKVLGIPLDGLDIGSAKIDELFESEDVARTLCKDFDEDDPEIPSFTNELTSIARIVEKII